MFEVAQVGPRLKKRMIPMRWNNLFRRVNPRFWLPTIGGLLLVCAVLCPQAAFGQIQQSAVGGVLIDTDGVLRNVSTTQQAQLNAKRLEALQPVDADLGAWTEMRKISLRRLEQALARHTADGEALSDEIRFLAGLQRVRYVFVDPQQHDVVLAGPAEGWKADPQGNIVGLTSGLPVLQLDDLLIALRTAEASRQGGLRCSIDPTSEGLNQLRSFLKQQGNRIGPNPAATIAGIEKSLGPQSITLSGLPGDSRFARVMVAADYRMKRLAMNLDPSPLRGMKSYLQMSGGRQSANMMPRWWMAPNYGPLNKSLDGLAWELTGPGVKALCEDDLVTEEGGRQHTNTARASVQAWATRFTESYPALSREVPIFGDLRNCMDLAVIGALISKENLTTKADLQLPIMMDTKRLAHQPMNVPNQVASQASVVKKGRNWVISASGGVEINAWAVVQETENVPALDETRSEAISDPAETGWWWN
jgi:hypothetical protein